MRCNYREIAEHEHRDPACIISHSLIALSGVVKPGYWPVVLAMIFLIEILEYTCVEDASMI